MSCEEYWPGVFKVEVPCVSRFLNVLLWLWNPFWGNRCIFSGSAETLGSKTSLYLSCVVMQMCRFFSAYLLKPEISWTHFATLLPSHSLPCAPPWGKWIYQSNARRNSSSPCLSGVPCCCLLPGWVASLSFGLAGTELDRMGFRWWLQLLGAPSLQIIYSNKCGEQKIESTTWP